jgi:hypothetical protein
MGLYYFASAIIIITTCGDSDHLMFLILEPYRTMLNISVLALQIDVVGLADIIP